MYTIEDLENRLLSELKVIADELGAKNYSRLPKKELIYKILDQQAILPESEFASKTTESKPQKPTAKPELKKRQRMKREDVIETEKQEEQPYML